MTDQFENTNSGLESPARNAALAVLSDTTDLPFTSRFLYIGSGGDLSVDLVGNADADNPVLFTNVASGIFPFRVKRIRTTQTTASNIVVAW